MKATTILGLGAAALVGYLVWKKYGQRTTMAKAQPPGTSSLWNPTAAQTKAFYDYYRTPRENTRYAEGDYRRYQSPANTPFNIVAFAQNHPEASP